MPRKCLLCLFSIVILSGFPALAQSDELPPQEDTVTTRTTIEVAPVETMEDDGSGYRFRPLNEMDSIRLQQRQVPDSVIRNLQQEDDFWYANTTIEKEKPKQEKKEFRYEGSPAWVTRVLWVVIVGLFLSVLVYYMAESGLFRRRRSIPDVAVSGDPEQMPEDIFAIQYQKEIDKAVAIGDYRLAVRLQYLRLLKHMAEKNIIRYQQDRTNMDYLMQLHTTGYYHDFFRITQHYEYSWYGHFTVSLLAYQLITAEVKNFENKS